MRLAILLGVLVATLAAAGRDARAWPWEKKEKRAHTELEELLAQPTAYEGQTVAFRCRFALQGRLFKHFNTRFSPDAHANFAVWEAGAPLWDDDARREVLPTLYVEKRDLAALQALRSLRRYDLVEVRGTILGTYANLPWILVDEIKPVGTDEDTITDTAIVHVRRGRELLETGESALAARHFEMAMEQGIPSAQQATVLQWLGKARARAGKYAEAAETYARAVAREPDDAEMRLAYARVLLELERADAAAGEARAVLDLSADYPEAHGILAEAYAMQGQYEQALEEADLGLHVPGLGPRERAMAEVHRARVLTLAGRTARAVRGYARAIGEGSPLAAEVWLRKEIGRLYESEFDRTGELAMLEEAEREYANANVLAGSEDPEALYLLARILYKRSQAVDGADLPRARELLRQALELDPDYAPAKELLGRIAMARGEVEEARRLLREAADTAGDARAFVSLGLNYEKLGQVREAVHAYEKALALDPTDRQALSHHAELLAAEGNLPGALEDYAVLVRLEPEEPAYRLRQGELAIRAGDLRLAETTLKPVVRQGGTHARTAAVRIARIHLKQGNPGKAEAIYAAILEEDPAHREATEGLARLALARGETGLAVETAERALAKNPQNTTMLELLGRAELLDDRADAAAATLDRIPADRRTREQWLLLARAALASGREAAATEGLQEALAPIRPEEDPHDVQPIMREAEKLLKTIDRRIDARRRERETREALARTAEEAARLSDAEAAPAPADFGEPYPTAEPGREAADGTPLSVRPLEIPGTVYVHRAQHGAPAALEDPARAPAARQAENDRMSREMSVEEMLRRAEALEAERGIVTPETGTDLAAARADATDTPETPKAWREPETEPERSGRAERRLPFIAEELIPPELPASAGGGARVMPATWTDAPEPEFGADGGEERPGPVSSTDFEIEDAELSALTAVPWADAPPVAERARRHLETARRTAPAGSYMEERSPGPANRAEVLLAVPGVVEIPGPWHGRVPEREAYAAMAGPRDGELRRNEVRNLEGRISRITGLARPQAAEADGGEEGPVRRTARGRTVLMQVAPGRQVLPGEPELDAGPEAGGLDDPFDHPGRPAPEEPRYAGEDLSDLPEWAR
jgi:tetratricopeptide (TPR) repeat protein